MDQGFPLDVLRQFINDKVAQSSKFFVHGTGNV